MKNKLFILVISIAVGLSIASGGLCTALSVKIDKTGCEKKRLSRWGLTQDATGTCHHVTPCQAQKGRFFLLPDSFSRRSQDDIRSIFSQPGPAVNVQRNKDDGPLQAGRNNLKFPSMFYPPRVFSLHCAYLC
jgi:hypothetical protein